MNSVAPLEFLCLMFYSEFLFKPTDPLCEYYDFQFCVFIGFLCILKWLWKFLKPFLWLFFCFLLFFLSCPIPLCAVLFYPILVYYHFLNAYSLSNKSQKGCGFASEKKWRRSRRRWGKGNHTRNILHESHLFFVKGK